MICTFLIQRTQIHAAMSDASDRAHFKTPIATAIINMQKNRNDAPRTKSCIPLYLHAVGYIVGTKPSNANNTVMFTNNR